METQIKKIQEVFNREIKESKRKIKMSNTIAEMKITLEQSVAEHLKQRNRQVSWNTDCWKPVLGTE